MAIEFNFVKSGRTINDVYAVLSIGAFVKNERLLFLMDIYGSKAARQAKEQPLETKKYDVPEDVIISDFSVETLRQADMDIFKCGYIWIKTLDGSEGNGIDLTLATDILEQGQTI